MPTASPTKTAPSTLRTPTHRAPPPKPVPLPKGPRPWTFNRFGVVLAYLLVLVANLIYFNFRPSGFFTQESVLLVPGLIGTIMVLTTGRAWAQLTGGILVALQPLIVILVFGAAAGFLHPVTNGDFASALLLVGGIVVGLTAGIRGFQRTRNGLEQTSLAGGWPSGWGNAATAIVASALVATLTVAHLPGEGAASAVPIDQHLAITMKGNQFTPSTINVHRNNVTELMLDNVDTMPHTFTFVYDDGEERSVSVSAGEQGSLTVLFKTAGTIKVRCKPHSTGYDDAAGMTASIVVA